MSREAALKAWETRRANAAAADGLIEFTVPERFWQDHIDRSNDPEALQEAEVRGTSKGIVVRLTEDQLGELEMDAEFYGDGGGGFGPEYRGLMSSARATVARIKKLRGD